MANWNVDINQHPLSATLQDLVAALDEIEVSSITEMDAIESIDRIRQAKKFFDSALANTELNLLSVERLQEVDNLFSAQLVQIHTFQENKNSNHLIRAADNINDLLAIISHFPIANTPADVDGLRESIGSFRRSVGQHARNLESEYQNLTQQFEDINRRFTEFTSEITSQKSRLDTAITQFQQQFSDAESKRREEYATEANTTRAELNKIVQADKETLDALITSLKGQFGTAEEKRNSEYLAQFDKSNTVVEELVGRGKTQLSAFTTQFDETLTRIVSEANASRESMEIELAERADTYISQLEIRKGEAETLVQVIGNTGMVGGYQKIANQERHAAWIWHGVTFVFMVGLVLFAIIAFHSTIQGDFKLGTFGARAFVALAFGIGVAWAARQADKHQEIERRSRKMELELASINPYLALLPEETQFSVKTELAQRFFGQSDPVLESKSDKQVTGSALDLLRMALEIIGKGK